MESRGKKEEDKKRTSGGGMPGEDGSAKETEDRWKSRSLLMGGYVKREWWETSSSGVLLCGKLRDF